MSERRFNDSRFDFFELGGSNRRASVKHIKELGPSSKKPRSFIHSNGILEPITFSAATEPQTRWFTLPLGHEHYRYTGGGKECSFHHEPLSDTRPKRQQRNDYFHGFVGLPEEPHIPISQVPIFKLSEACVGKILSYLDDSDLANLALVDKDCRQLARARQFRSVWLNFSSTSLALLKKVFGEACDRVGYTSGPKWFLGTCIRRISVTYGKDPSLPAGANWIETRRRNQEAVERHQAHENLLEIILPNAVPNLEWLDWRSRIPITPVIIRAITQSPITKLELDGVALTHDFDISGTERERRWQDNKWQLRVLVLRLNVSLFKPDVTTALFTSSILKLAAPTLEQLVWDGCSEWEMDRKHSFGPEPVIFPKLEKLQLVGVRMVDDTVLPALIQTKDGEGKLAHLYIDMLRKEDAPFFEARHIPSLKHLIWTDFTLYHDIDQSVSFIDANPQLETFRFEDPSPELTDKRLVPLFASRFRSLTSLALVWETTTIDPATLTLIGKITTLKHLWLSAGKPFGPEIDWIVDQKSLRDRLSPLKRLERFALTRDGYTTGNDYVWLTNQSKSQEWEDKHRKAMAIYARLFALSHPNLEWVYFGQISMSVEWRTGAQNSVVCVPLTQRREDQTSLLCEMWGKYRDNWVYE